MEKVTDTLLFKAYVLSFCFSFILVFPCFGSKIQLPELIFPFLFIAAKPWKWIREINTWQGFSPYIVIFILGLTAITFIRPGITAWLNLLGLVYLFMVYQVTAWIMAHLENPAGFLYSTIKVFSICLLLTVCFSWSNYFFQIPLGAELLEPKYMPGTGYLLRAEAFTASPNMLASFLSFCLLCRFSRILYRKKQGFRLDWLDLGLLLALASTFSKSIMIFAAACLVLSGMYSGGRAARATFFYSGALVLALAYVFGTNFLVVKKGGIVQEEIWQQTYFSGHLVKETEGYQLYETTHMALKRNALDAFRQDRLWGIGGGNFPAFLKKQQERGRYPSGLPVYDPHSTYLGVLAEYGMIGFSLFILFWIKAGYFSWKERLAWKGEEGALITGVTAFFMMLAVEAMAMDILNLRHLWFGLGIIAGFSGIRKNRQALPGYGQRK